MAVQLRATPTPTRPSVEESKKPLAKLPRAVGSADYTDEAATARRVAVEQHASTSLTHVAQYSFDPQILQGNVEGFAGVAQVPIGFAGPLLVDGEYAKGEFYVPLATSEGTLVASYSRGMRLCREAGGIRTTIVDEAMQRAPLFVFSDARAAREFGKWVDAHRKEIAAAAESTTSVGTLETIEQYAIGKLRWLRMDFATGDAAGQNMVTRAARQACLWILAQQPEGLVDFELTAQLDTDKKHSVINDLHTRGKRVVAEVTLPADLIAEVMHTSPAALFRARQYANLGALLSGAGTNGNHVANAVAAMFIACGQDVANVAESGCGFVYGEITDDGDYYYSLTIPSLIVATYGGGTGLPTQRECLETLDCYGAGKARKLAEIVAATALCGEVSLGSAVVADEWVSSHERYGRNR
jgi:hydroxymethylglutaryl-CoA reductase (NADPH)